MAIVVLTYFTFRRLEYFVAVGEAGSVVAASEKLKVSSPSISAAILRLEEDFRVQLFVRQHTRGLSLTHSGRLLFQEVKKLLKQADNLQHIAVGLSETVSGDLHIGCLQTVAPFIFPALRKSFEAQFPDVQVHQTETNQSELLVGLHNANFDVCLTYDLEIPTDICFNALVELPAYVMVAPTHSLAGRRVIYPEHLEQECLILLDLPISSKYFLSMFQLAGIKPKITERLKNIASVRSMVANGFGYSLANLRSKSELAEDGRPLKYIPLKSELRALRLGLAFCPTDYLTSATDAFKAHCCFMLGKEKIGNIAVT